MKKLPFFAKILCYTSAACATVALLLGIGVALAQTIIPVVPTIGTNDYFQDVPNGNPGVGNVYAKAAQIAGVPGYVNGGVAVTAFTYTFGNSVTDYFIQPAGTLATGTLTTAANPSDGQRECFLSTQTQTALTWNANTGQSISGAPTAGVANTPYCMTYNLAALTWYRSP
jgi:hypothetical protein